MCGKCLHQPMPDRGTIVLESGCYLVNYKGCIGCGGFSMMKVVDKKVVEDETSETITFTHVCPDCTHVVCEHSYEFKVKGNYQKFEMNCQLCGYGSDKRSVLPEDPREMGKYDFF